MIKIYEEGIKTKKDVFLRLIRNESSDTVTLIAADEQGNRLPMGNLLEISEKGVRFATSIDEDFGFEMDAGCKIKLIK